MSISTSNFPKLDPKIYQTDVAPSSNPLVHIPEDQPQNWNEESIQELRIKYPDLLKDVPDGEVLRFVFDEEIVDTSPVDIGNGCLETLTELTFEEIQNLTQQNFDALRQERPDVCEFLLSLSQYLATLREVLSYDDPSEAREAVLKEILRAEHALNCHKYFYFAQKCCPSLDPSDLDFFEVVAKSFSDRQDFFSIDDKIALFAMLQNYREQNKNGFEEYERLICEFKAAFDKKEVPAFLKNPSNQKIFTTPFLKLKSIRKNLKFFFEKLGIERHSKFFSTMIVARLINGSSQEPIAEPSKSLKYSDLGSFDLSILKPNELARIKDKYCIKFIQKDKLETDEAYDRMSLALGFVNYVFYNTGKSTTSPKMKLFNELLNDPKNVPFIENGNLKKIQRAFVEKIYKLAFKAQRFLLKSCNAMDSETRIMPISEKILSKKNKEKISPLHRLVNPLHANVVKGSYDEKFCLIELERIGEGGYNDVNSVWIDSKGFAAARRLRLNGLPDALEEWDKEVSVLRELSLKLEDLMVRDYHIIAIDDVVEGIITPKERCMILEECKGDLRHLKREFLSNRQLRVFGIELCQALNILHESKILYADLKPENILYVSDQEDEELLHIKLADFGKVLSFDQVNGSMLKSNGVLGTISYQAPECFLQIPLDRLNPSALDMWSLGLVLYSLRENVDPFLNSLENISHDHTLIALALNAGYKEIFEAIIEAKGINNSYESICYELEALEKQVDADFEDMSKCQDVKNRCQEAESAWAEEKIKLKALLIEKFLWSEEESENAVTQWMKGDKISQLQEKQTLLLSLQQLSAKNQVKDQLIQDLLEVQYRAICDEIKKKIEEGEKKTPLDAVILNTLTMDIEKRYTAGQALEYLTNQTLDED